MKAIITVENIYDTLAIDITIKRANERRISAYTHNLYAKCASTKGNPLNGMSLEEFAAYTANFNPGKAGIGQKSQMDCLRSTRKFPKFTQLPSSGSGAKSLIQKGNTVVIGSGKSNLRGVKSFDAINEGSKTVTLFMLKSVDIGSFSSSIGGGHQDNVRAEIETLISALSGKKLQYNGKKIKIVVLVAGRSADSIILRCKSLLSHTDTVKLIKQQ